MANSYNELFGLGSHTEDAALEGWWKLQDDAASTAVDDVSSNNQNGTATFNTSAQSSTGPNSWLPKAIDFGIGGVNTTRYITLPTVVTAKPVTIAMWLDSELTLDNQGAISLSDASTSSAQDCVSVDQNFNNDISLYFRNTSDNFIDPNRGDTGWTFVAAALESESLRRLYLNDELVGTSTATTTAITYSAIEIGRFSDSTPGSYFQKSIAGVSIFSRVLSASEVDEIRIGPEPLNTVSPTLTIDSSSWSGTVGTWDSQSNGTITYAWELRDDSDDSVVESGTGSSPSGSGTYSGDYYLWLRASNDGGYDAAEDSVSAVETVGGGVTTLTADTVSFTLTGQNTALVVDRLVGVDAGEFALAGQTASLVVARKLQASVGEVSLAGQDVTFIKSIVLSVDSGTLEVTGQAAVTLAARKVAAGAASFAITGQDATLRVARKVAVDPGSLTLSGQDVNFVIASTFVADVGEFVLTGNDASFQVDSVLSAATASFAVTGQAAGLTYSGNVVSTGILGLRANGLLLLRI